MYCMGKSVFTYSLLERTKSEEADRVIGRLSLCKSLGGSVTEPLVLSGSDLFLSLLFRVLVSETATRECRGGK